MDHWDHIEQVALENSDNDGDFYKDAADYWSKIPPTVDGMLGGYGFISSIDINGSNQFLKQLFRVSTPVIYLLSCLLFFKVMFHN